MIDAPVMSFYGCDLTTWHSGHVRDVNAGSGWSPMQAMDCFPALVSRSWITASVNITDVATFDGSRKVADGSHRRVLAVCVWRQLETVRYSGDPLGRVSDVTSRSIAPRYPNSQSFDTQCCSITRISIETWLSIRLSFETWNACSWDYMIFVVC